MQGVIGSSPLILIQKNRFRKGTAFLFVSFAFLPGTVHFFHFSHCFFLYYML